MVEERTNSEGAGDVEVGCCVVGAGAAGLWAAEVAARGGEGVLVLEKTPRAGTKVLASGGTRCNLTTTLEPDAAAELFGRRGARFLRNAFRQLTPEDVRARFASWGVATEVAPLEKVFPASGRAVDVRDALERAARTAGAQLRADAAVVGVEARADGRWTVALAGGGAVHAQRLILCPGGKSYPRTGTTGDGYAWLEQLDLEVVEPVPALVPLTSDDTQITSLTGIAVQDVVAKLVRADGGKPLGERRRPVLFTHTGVSGPAAMDLSVHVARAHAEARRRGQVPPRFRLVLDLAPEQTREELRQRVIDGQGWKGNPRLSEVLPVELPRRLLAAVLAQAEFGLRDGGKLRVAGLDRAHRHRLVEALKGFDVPIDGTRGWDQAEVTAGGLALSRVSPGTLAVKGRPGLYVCGELLDLAGPIGGLSFQAAFATAELAGGAGAERG